MKDNPPTIPGCLSCDIVAGRRLEPGGVLYQDEYWHVGSALESPHVWPGFLIIKLKRHCEQIAELTPAEAAAFGPILHAACQALTNVLHPAKVYVCSFGEGVKHIHFWLLPRPVSMHPGMHWTLLSLDLRIFLARTLRIKRWAISETEVTEIAHQLRQSMAGLLEPHEIN